MRKIFICLFFCGMVLQSSGCWVRFEANDHPDYAPYVGKTVETIVDIIIQEPSFMMGTLGFPAEKAVFRHQYLTLPAGAVLKITGLSSRRLESGVHYCFECRYDGDGKPITFDYPVTSMIDGKWVVAGHFKFLN